MRSLLLLSLVATAFVCSFAQLQVPKPRTTSDNQFNSLTGGSSQNRDDYCGTGNADFNFQLRNNAVKVRYSGGHSGGHRGPGKHTARRQRRGIRGGWVGGEAHRPH